MVSGVACADADGVRCRTSLLSFDVAEKIMLDERIRDEVRLVYHVPRLQSGRNSGSPAGYAVLIVLYIYMLVAHHT